MSDDRPPVILCNKVGSYPWQVLKHRHPALIAQTRAAFEYPPSIEHALDTLLDEIQHHAVTPLPDDEHDAHTWLSTGAQFFGRSWFDAPFLWAESYFYRRLLHAVDYFHQGRWAGVDPFGPVKAAELANPSIDADLASLDHIAELPPDARLVALTEASLWGNLADLGFQTANPDAADGERAPDPITDASPALWNHIRGRLPRVGFVTDNAATELLHDLALIDHLLATRMATRVTMHLKRFPYFVSDATSRDVVDCLARLDSGPPAAQAIAHRLFRAYDDGRLRDNDADVFVAPTAYRDGDVEQLANAFADDDIVLAKGDLNYRRLAGDRHWHGTEPFVLVLTYFPKPVAVFRTIKSEVVIGLDQPTLDELARWDPQWRGNGRHALIQARLS
jgi:uncharacterized protein with ATP-grasp and redox domains